MKTLQIIFLDIDGVVVSDRTNNQAICAWYSTSSVEEAYKVRKERLDNGLYVPKCMGVNSAFDPVAVRYLNTLACRGVQFVVTSTWRENQTVRSLSAIFEMKGLHIPVLDFTAVDSKPRGLQILEWLQRNDARGISGWSVVDDCQDDLAEFVGDRLVVTDPFVGLDQAAHERICEMLGISNSLL